MHVVCVCHVVLLSASTLVFRNLDSTGNGEHGEGFCFRTLFCFALLAFFLSQLYFVCTHFPTTTTTTTTATPLLCFLRHSHLEGGWPAATLPSCRRLSNTFSAILSGTRHQGYSASKEDNRLRTYRKSVGGSCALPTSEVRLFTLRRRGICHFWIQIRLYLPNQPGIREQQEKFNYDDD